MELVERYGGEWATTTFRAGDALIFGMYAMHASLTNTTDRFRITSGTRYQLAGEPADGRWIGENPIGHRRDPERPRLTMAEARRRWGV